MQTSSSPLETTTADYYRENSGINMNINADEEDSNDDFTGDDDDEEGANDSHTTTGACNEDNGGNDKQKNRNHLLSIARIQQKLIYDFAIKYKKTPRITFFTCHSATKIKEHLNDKSARNVHDGNEGGNTKYIRMLKRMYASETTPTASSSRTNIMQSSNNFTIMQLDQPRDENAQQETNFPHDTYSEPKGVLIKVVRIDQLINNRASSSSTYKNLYSGAVGGFVAGNAHGNWLDRVLNADDGRRQIIVLDLACGEASQRLLQMASNKALFNSTFHWLLMEDYILRRDNKSGTNENDAKNSEHDIDDSLEIIENFLAKLNININTELTLAKSSRSATRCNQIGFYTVHDVWSPGFQYGGELNITEIGNFTLADGLTIHTSHLRTSTVLRRVNMKQARIRCMIVVTNKNRTDSLEHYLTTYYDTHLDSMNRFNFALLSYVRDLYNFSFILSRTASWGYLKNGKFDGMIGALVRQQADVGGSPIFFRIERAKVIDYTVRTWVARPCFIFRHPRSTKKDRIVFLQPFSNIVWLLLALCGTITIILLWLLTILETALDAQKGTAMPVTRIGAKGGRAQHQRQYQPFQSHQHIHNEDRMSNNETRVPFVSEIQFQPPNVLTQQQHISHGTSSNVDVMHSNIVATTQKINYAGRLKKLFIRGSRMLCAYKKPTPTSERRSDLFFESILFYVGSICQQGLSYTTRFFSGRCIIITSLLFSFSIYQFYSASIVGTLLMERPKTIRTLRDLIHSSLDIGIEDIVYNRDFFLRTKDNDAIELYAKKVTSVPKKVDQNILESPPDSGPIMSVPNPVETEVSKAKSYRDILHNHEAGAHAKTNEASNWYEPEYGVAKIKKGKFAFHVDVATAYKIIAETFSEKEICELTEVQLFPPQKMVSIVQKGSPVRKIITYGMRRVTEAGLMDYQRKVWQSPKPRCVKQLHTDDLRVDMQTFTSALLVLLFGFALSLFAFGIEIVHFRLRENALQQQ